MAELNMPQKNGKRKLQSPRVDLTPMVDLGFLLITFFMFTTTLANPKVMELNMPSNEKSPGNTVFTAESTITLIPIKGHEVIYFYGILTGKEQLHETAIHGVLDILLKKKKAVADLPLSFSKEAHRLHVMIKPIDNCKYEDVVQLLDDMTIVNVQIYALTDISVQEEMLVKENF